LRALFFLGPVIAVIVTRRICLSLQRKDRELVLHGHEAGVIEMSPEGGFHERHRQLTDYELYRLVSFEDRRPVPAMPGRNGKVGTL
ncbi:ubiquinol-cytochrome c reductase cytochrome b subunit, partial [Salmonella enterica subsp. enterica serovar Typhimurium]